MCICNGKSDVIIKKVDSIPLNAIKIKPVNGKNIIAYAALTGKAHVIDSVGCTAYDLNGIRYLCCHTDTRLTCQRIYDPSTIKLFKKIEKGVYEVEVKQKSKLLSVRLGMN